MFDKTGTLTKGNFAVAAAVPEENGDEILRLAAIAERDSDHPIARSIAEKYGKKTEGGYTLTNVAGEGVAAEKGSDTILCGNEKLMERYGIACADPDATGTVVHVAHCGDYKGYLVIEDEVKPEAADVIAELNAMGCRTVMLTGDNERVAAAVAKKTGVTEHRSSLLPQNKVGEVERLLSEKKRSEALCFVGDG